MGLKTTFETIAKLPLGQSIPYLQAALAEPYPEIQLRAFQLLDSLNRPDIVVQCYTSLLPEVREKLGERKFAYIDTAKKLVEAGLDRHRRAAYEFLANVGEVEAATILAAGVNDASTIVRDDVASALEKIALRYHYNLLNWHTRGDEQSKEFVDRNKASMLEAMETLLRTYQIHRKDIFVDIAIESGGEAYRLIKEVILARKEGPLHESFFRAMESVSSGSAIETLFRLLHDDDERMNDFARTVFIRRRDSAFLTAISDYLMKIPDSKFPRLGINTRELPWWPALSNASDLSAVTCETHIAFIQESQLTHSTKEQYLRHFLNNSLALVRARALRALKELGSENLTDLARSGLKDADPEVQIVAAAIIAEANPSDKVRLLTPLIQSEHEGLRHLAMREVAQASFERYLNSFDKLDAKTRELAAKAISKIDGSMMDRVAEEVKSLDPERRLKALQVLNFAEKGTEGQPIIRDMLNDDDKRVRATAIKLVEMTGNVEAMKEVIQLLNDPDRRVRANAIEAFEEIGDTRFAQILLPFCEDPDNRVRANAVKALWNLGRKEVVDVLLQMLLHEDTNMRLSAVWAFAEIRPEGAAEVLARRQGEEADPKVLVKIHEALESLKQDK